MYERMLKLLDIITYTQTVGAKSAFGVDLAFCKRADNSELGRNYANLAIIIEKSGKSRNSKIEKIP